MKNINKIHKYIKNHKNLKKFLKSQKVFLKVFFIHIFPPYTGSIDFNDVFMVNLS